MADREKILTWLEICGKNNDCSGCCPYSENGFGECDQCRESLMADAYDLLKEQEKEVKALRLLVEWAEECDFGFDQFPDEYERYKDEIKDMGYIDGMIHVAKRTLEEDR